MAATDWTGGAWRPRGRVGRVRKVIGLVVVACLLIYGAVLLGLGLSGLHKERALATSGVPVVARVSATSGYGRDTIQLSYPARGWPERGTVNAVARHYWVGETVLAVYDPSAPQVVGLAGDVSDTGSAWGEIGGGGFVLVLLPVIFLFAMAAGRRRRRRAVRALLGG